MKAIAVHPGKASSIHLADIAGARGRRRARTAAACWSRCCASASTAPTRRSTRREYGAAPARRRLPRHGPRELRPRASRSGPNVPTTIRPGDLVVSTVRRPGSSIYDQIGLQDFTTDDVYYERGINLLHGYLTERYVEDSEYVVPLPESLSEVGVLLEPTTVAEKGINQAFEIQRRLKVWRPRRAAVLGSGTIGLLAPLVAAAARARGRLLLAAEGAVPERRPDRGARRRRTCHRKT